MNKKEADKLGPGDLICREDDPSWTFIVSQNFGDRLIAVRTIELHDLTKWRKVQKTKEEPSAPCLEVSGYGGLDEASLELSEKLKHEKWFRLVGLAPAGTYNPENYLVVYTRLKKYPKPYETFRGFRVEYKYMSDPAPLGQPMD